MSELHLALLFHERFQSNLYCFLPIHFFTKSFLSPVGPLAELDQSLKIFFLIFLGKSIFGNFALYVQPGFFVAFLRFLFVSFWVYLYFVHWGWPNSSRTFGSRFLDIISKCKRFKSSKCGSFSFDPEHFITMSPADMSDARAFRLATFLSSSGVSRPHVWWVFFYFWDCLPDFQWHQLFCKA